MLSLRFLRVCVCEVRIFHFIFHFPYISAKNLEEFVRMGIAFRDYAGPIFMDIVTELRDLGDQPILHTYRDILSTDELSNKCTFCYTKNVQFEN